MADNTNKVTIDAAYFNHLFARASERERLWSDREGLILECGKIAKERDELKAKLDCADVDRETYKDRAEAAERCIEDAYAALTKWNNNGDDAAVRSMFDNALAIIFAYREKKEAAR